MSTKGVCSQALIDTLNGYSRLTLNRYSIDTPSTPWLTLDQHLGQQSQSTNFRLMHKSQLTLG